MKVVALLSGGKDSAYNLLHCALLGHEVVALANLYPPASHKSDEMDSFMYQTVGYSAVEHFSECLGNNPPLYRRQISGKSLITTLEYHHNPTYTNLKDIPATDEPASDTVKDETEDLYSLLRTVLKNHPEVKGVSVGAILSTYQRVRVENVCQRLGLTCLAFLWERSQDELLDEIIASGLDARVIKTAAYGLGKEHLGKSLAELRPLLVRLNQMYGIHLCGEGGEYETLVLDSPMFKRKLIPQNTQVVEHSGNDNVYFLHFGSFKTEEKKGYNPLDISNWKDKVAIPPLLDSTYEEVLNQIRTDDLYYRSSDSTESPNVLVEATEGLSISEKSKPKNDDDGFYSNSFYQPDATMHIHPRVIVNKTLGTVWISNITAPPMASDYPVERVTDLIFDKARQYLTAEGLTFANVMYAHVLLKDMSDFAAFNEVYSTFFADNGPNPPARVCVENGSLVHNSRVQLALVATRNLETRSGLHVQSRSYWAPANIGPYSQAVTSSDDGLVYLSGQIPLLPPTMKLLETDAFEVHSVLSLQHINRVSEAVKSKYYAGIITYVTSPKAGDAVAKTWPGYLSVTSWAGVEDELPKDEVDYFGHRINVPLFIVQLSGLPRGASIEWSGYGINSETLSAAKAKYDEQDSDEEDFEKEDDQDEDDEEEQEDSEGDENEEDEEEKVKESKPTKASKKPINPFFFKPRYKCAVFKDLFEYKLTRYGLQAMAMFTYHRELTHEEILEFIDHVFYTTGPTEPKSSQGAVNSRHNPYDKVKELRHLEDTEEKFEFETKSGINYKPTLISGTLFYTSSVNSANTSAALDAPENTSLLDEVKVDNITMLDRRKSNQPFGYMLRMALVE